MFLCISVFTSMKFRAAKDEEDNEITEICETFKATVPRILRHFTNDTAYETHCQIYVKLNEIMGHKQ